VTHFEPQRFWRAYLTCETCGTVVAVGPAEPHPAMAAYRLGCDGGADARRHLGKCAGGALVCTTEEQPAPAPPLLDDDPPLVPTPRRGRGPRQISAARALTRLIRKGAR
jgi:hypothetical protein